MKGFVLQNSGLWNGYVAIPKGHPAYGKDYDEIDVEIHGGLTFGNYSSKLDNPSLPKFDEEHWVVGFDTAHAGDTREYWTKERVLKETEFLKTQLLDMMNVKFCGTDLGDVDFSGADLRKADLRKA